MAVDLQRWRWILAPALGGLATLGFAPYGQWYLTLLALACLLLLAARAGAVHAALLGWLFGAGNFGTGVYWVYISTHVYGGAPAWLGASLAASLSAGLALFPALALGAAARLRLFARPLGWAALPGLWVLGELVRGRYFFDGFPWLALGETLVDTPVARLAPLLGVHGLSAVVALGAYALFRIGAGTDRRARLVAAAVLAAPLLTVLLPRPSAWTVPDGSPVAVALVQSNIKQDEKWLPAMRYEALGRHWRLTQQAWPADLVIWPEVALTQPYHQLKDGYLADLDQQARKRNASILLGILVFEGETHYNSVATIGASAGRYDKRHLVPFGEYFPIPDFLRPLMDVLGTPYSDFAFGARVQAPLTVGGRPVAVSICFEDVFGDEVRRDTREAAYHVNVTNDAWFGTSSAAHQHLTFTRLRAMENGRWFARTANTGISALIDPDGRIVARSTQFETEVVRGTLEPRTGVTPYQRWGDWPLWLAAPLLVAVAIWGQVQKARSEPDPNSPSGT